MTSSNGNSFRITGHLCGDFTGHQCIPRTKACSFDVFFDLYRNKRLSKQSWSWWFETPSRSLWCHSNDKSCQAIRDKLCHVYIYILKTFICHVLLLLLPGGCAFVNSLGPGNTNNVIHIIISVVNGFFPVQHQTIIWIITGSLRLGDTYMCQWTMPSLLQIMACRLIGAKPLS